MRHANALVAGALTAALMAGTSQAALAQAAGAGADSNRKDRQKVWWEAERQRVKEYDKPVQKCPVGNAIIGGVVSGVIKGSAEAGALSLATGTAVNTAVGKLKEGHIDRPNGRPYSPGTLTDPDPYVARAATSPKAPATRAKPPAARAKPAGRAAPPTARSDRPGRGDRLEPRDHAETASHDKWSNVTSKFH